MTEPQKQQSIYVVTDIEADGLVPGENSMMSFASVAVDEAGTQYGTFEAVLSPLDGAKPNPVTLAWFQTVPAAYAAATLDPKPPAHVMAAFEAWVRHLPGRAVFAAHPVIFDGLWIDYYLRRFSGHPLFQPFEADRLFHGHALCIRALAIGALWPNVPDAGSYPADWLGNHEHTHRAVDDARGYAHLLNYLLERARSKQTGDSAP